MSRRTPRQIPRISYCEPVELNGDEYIFCDKCGDDVYEYCAIHGPLLAIPDDKIPAVSPYPPIVPRAALSVPTEFLHLNYSSIPGAGLGVFASTRLGVGARFGPYRGRRTRALASDYCWQIYDARGAPAHLVDAADGDCSNWMRFVNCSRHSHEQNLLAFQYRGELYYRTIKVVPQYTELLVFYGSEFAKKLNIDLKNYNKSATHFAQKSAPPRKKPKLAIEDSSEKKCSPAHIKQTNIITSDYGLPTVLCDGPSTEHMITRDDKPKKLNHEVLRAQTKIVPNYEQGKIKKKIKTTKMCHKTLKENKQYNVNTKENLHETKNTSRKRRSDTKVLPVRQTDNKEIANKNVSSNLADVNKDNILNSTRDMHFFCKICDYRSVQKDAIRKHMRFHDTERKFVCSKCTYRFKTATKLNEHLKTHTGDKPYACDMCNYRCASANNLKIHLRTHTGEKPYACDMCNYRCTLAGNLKRHLRTHTGEKPYACDMCNYRCAQAITLKIHLRTHTGEKPYACDICSYRCTVASHLKNHLLRIHLQKP